MNREKKFRGKRVDNGEWVYGGIWISKANDYYIITADYLKIKERSGLMSIGVLEDETHMHWVKRDTVGQFTGLKDKNGKQIYEGDIVRDRWNSYTPIYQNAIYMAYNAEKINDLYVSTQFNIIWRNGCEVIGNIHDNKELIEFNQSN